MHLAITLPSVESLLFDLIKQLATRTGEFANVFKYGVGQVTSRKGSCLYYIQKALVNFWESKRSNIVSYSLFNYIIFLIISEPRFDQDLRLKNGITQDKIFRYYRTMYNSSHSKLENSFEQDAFRKTIQNRMKIALKYSKIFMDLDGLSHTWDAFVPGGQVGKVTSSMGISYKTSSKAVLGFGPLKDTSLDSLERSY